MSERKTLGLSPLIIIEPNPILIEYYQKAKEFEIADMFTSKTGNGEWLYIQSNLDQNIFLLKRLDDLGLIPHSGKICDCGIGLGTAIFDIYLQSKEIGKDYTFVGIEKHTRYTDYLEASLLNFWDGRLDIVKGDLMDQNYAGYDIVYSYTPFRDADKLREFYLKVISEMREGALLVENKNWGLGEGEILSSISEEIEAIDLDGLTVFRKK